MAQITRAERLQALLFLGIGLIVLLLVVFALVGLPFGDDTVKFRLRFVDSVIGLDEGTPVRYKGVKYGTIQSIAVDKERPEEIIVTLAVDPKTPVKVSTTARISTTSILGPFYIELLDSRADSPSLPEGSFIPARPSALSRILKTGETVGDELAMILANIATWTDAERRDAFFAMVGAAQGSLDRASRAIDRLVPELESTLAAWRGVAKTSDELLADLGPRIRRTAEGIDNATAELITAAQSAKVGETTEALRSAAARLTKEIETDGQALRAWLNSNQIEPFLARATTAFERLESVLAQSAKDLSSEATTLTRGDLAPLLQDVRLAVLALEQLASGLERNPRALLFGKPPTERPLPRSDGK